MKKDRLYDHAVSISRESGSASAHVLMRRLRISYSRAVGLLDAMEADGVIGPAVGSGPRQICNPVMEQRTLLNQIREQEFVEAARGAKALDYVHMREK